MTDELKQIMAVAETWTREPFDAETRAQVKKMMEAEDKTELIESFYRTLEFGTGGLRGIMGPGTNRMNKYIVAQATQGYANYLLKVAKVFHIQIQRYTLCGKQCFRSVEQEYQRCSGVPPCAHKAAQHESAHVYELYP